MLMTAAHASSPATAEVLISELKASQPEILQHIARSIPGTVPKHTDLICGARGREHPWQKWQTGHGDDEKDRQCSTGVARILTNHLDLHSGLVPVPRYVQATYRHLQRTRWSLGTGLHLRSVTVRIRLRFCHQRQKRLCGDNDDPRARRSCTKTYHIASGIAHSALSQPPFPFVSDNFRQGENTRTMHYHAFTLNFTQLFSLSVSEIISEVTGERI